jgi:acyl-coenzyme A thioesterase PaaI-like protein
MAAMAGFEEATRVVRRAGTGEFDVELDPQWSARDVLQGGYLLAVLARAGAEIAGPQHPHPASVSAVFLEPPRPGPAVAAIEVMRTGRSATHLRARLLEDGEPVVEAHLIQGRLEPADPWWSGPEPMAAPPPGACVEIPPEPPGVGFRVRMMEVIEERLDPKVLGFAAGRPSGAGLVAGYLQLRDGSDWDPFSLLVALDSGPPASFDIGIAGGAPTLQFSSYVRRLPAPGPIWMELQVQDAGGDRMTEQMRIWDSKRRLVGQANQLAAVRLP